MIWSRAICGCWSMIWSWSVVRCRCWSVVRYRCWGMIWSWGRSVVWGWFWSMVWSRAMWVLLYIRIFAYNAFVFDIGVVLLIFIYVVIYDLGAAVRK